MRLKVPRLFKDKTEAAIFFTALLVEIIFGLYLVQRWGFTFEEGDSISHLYIAGTVVNNGAQSNFANLGSVWLPMFHVLVMPLVLIEPLYTTGFAGTIVNSLATGGICVILYRLMGRGRLGILASFLFLANAFTLFFGATSMMEQTAIFFMVLASYYFKRYWEKDDLIEFMKCSLALLFGTLTRYEVWAVALLVTLFFAIKEVRARQFHRLAYIHFPFWGVFAWLFWNLAIFRDPLMFIRHPMAVGLQITYIYEGSSPYVGNLLLIKDFFLDALYTVSGAICLVSFTALIALIFVAVIRTRTTRHKHWAVLLPTILLISPIGFQFFTLYIGSSAPWIRYLYQPLAGLILLSLFPIKMIQTLGNPIRKIRKTDIHILSIFFILITISLYATSFPTQMSWIATACRHGRPVIYTWKEEYGVLKEIVGTKPILISGGQSYQSLTLVGIPPSQIIDDYDGSLFIEAMKQPWLHCSTVLIPDSPNLDWMREWNNHYNGTYYIYRYYNDESWRATFLDHFTFQLSLIQTGENISVFKLVGGS